MNSIIEARKELEYCKECLTIQSYMDLYETTITYIDLWVYPQTSFTSAYVNHTIV